MRLELAREVEKYLICHVRDCRPNAIGGGVEGEGFRGCDARRGYNGVMGRAAKYLSIVFVVTLTTFVLWGDMRTGLVTAFFMAIDGVLHLAFDRKA